MPFPLPMRQWDCDGRCEADIVDWLQVPVQWLLKPENIVRFNGPSEMDTLLHVVGCVHVKHQQRITNGLPRGLDAHAFLLERQTTGLQFDGPMAGSDNLSQLLGAARQRGIFDVIATGGVSKDLQADAAEELVKGHVGGLALDIPQSDVDAAERGHDLWPLATRQRRRQIVLSPHPPRSWRGEREKFFPHLKVRQCIHATDDLPELLHETTYQRQRSALNLAIPTETCISLDFDQDQGRFCADFVCRPAWLQSRDRQGICLYCGNLHARLLRA